jgi:beta-lactamase class A
MAGAADRRGVLTGLAALGLGACAREEAAAAPEPPALNLSDLETRTGGRIGVAVLDVGSGREDGWRRQERFAYCSTFKLFLAAATLERAQRGEERLDREIAIAASDPIGVSPVTEAAVGRSLTVERLCQAVVEVSDNGAANILTRLFGGLEPWRNWYRRIGDTTTTVDRLEPELNTALPNDPRDTALPEQTLENLRTVLLGDRLQPEMEARLEAWMVASPTGPGRIKAGAPAGWRVAHKTGTANGMVNDIGMLTPEVGSPVLLAVYFDGPDGLSRDAGEAAVAEATRQALRSVGRG